MTITNRLQRPAGLVRAVSTEKHNEPGCISATTLIQGIKHIILTERHWDELCDDVAERVWAIWGQAVHSLLESEGETEFTELDMSHKIGGITLTGRIDNYNMQNGVICDYKTASIWKVKLNDFSDWKKQGMIYAWLLAKNGFNVTKCRFIALLKDHSKSEIIRDSRYPESPVYVYEFAVNFVELLKIEAFIKQKVADYVKYSALSDDEIPPCDAGERWEKAAKYAVRKPGRKTAVRLYDSKADADSAADMFGKDHYVEMRPGESTKCRHFCLCCGFCNYYQEQVCEETAQKAA